MNQKLHQRGLWTLDELSAADAQTLLATARALKHAPGRSLPLKGKHVAVLSESQAGDPADVFTAAALDLGAQVTHIPPGTLRLAARGERRDTARVLGRLYDAIECNGLGQAFMLELKNATAAPVSNVLMPDHHPTRLLADLMTLQEVGGGPIGSLTLGVAGEEGAPWTQVWRQIGALTGLEVVAVPRSGAQGRAVDFLFDPLGATCADGHPALRMTARGNGNESSLASQQVTNHRYVVEALLAQTVE